MIPLVIHSDLIALLSTEWTARCDVDVIAVSITVFLFQSYLIPLAICLTELLPTERRDFVGSVDVVVVSNTVFLIV